MGVDDDRPVTGEVLSGRRHASLREAVHESPRQDRYDLGRAMKRSVADDFAYAPVKVQHGGETEIYADRPQFRRHKPAENLRRPAPVIRIEIILSPDQMRGRQCREAVTESLHAAALVVHGDEQRRPPHRVDLDGQAPELPGIPIVAAEQDDAADQRVGEHLPVLRTKLEALDVDHEGAERHASSQMSTGVPTGTWSNSSITSRLRILIHPCDAATPTDSVSGVPCM